MVSLMPCWVKNELWLILARRLNARLEGGTAPRLKVRLIANRTGGRCPPLNERLIFLCVPSVFSVTLVVCFV